MNLSPAELSLISDNATADVRALALRLKASADVRPEVVLRQVEGRQMVRTKVPSWPADRLLFPRHLSMEQCSTEATAMYKTKLATTRCTTATLVDLTGGFGVDFCFMQRAFARATYVEMQSELVEIARHNFPILCTDVDTRIDAVHSEAEVFLRSITEPVSCIFLDPARRDTHGRKVISIADCSPDVSALEDELLSKSECAIVKLSPMLDVVQTLERLKHVAEVHVVAVGNECKEMLLVLRHDAVSGSARVVATNIKTDENEEFSFALEDERKAGCDFAAEPATYLYEPNAAIMKSGAFRCVGERFGVRKLHVNSHLYTSHTLTDFPGRRFVVEGYAPLKKNVNKELLADVRKANVAVRNFPLSAEELRKRLKLGDGGDVYIFATTTLDDRRVIVRCRKI